MKKDFAVITMSDKGARGEREDTSGPNLIRLLESHGFSKRAYQLIPDNFTIIRDTLSEMCQENIALIVTTGGTGVSPSDVTPEATRKVIDREIPGMAELMRLESLKVTNRACLSRGVTGSCGESLIINLPGSKKGAQENLEALLDVLPHALEKLQGDEGDCGK